MKPVLAGYTNPEQEADSDNPSRRRPVFLSAEHFMTHLHGVGATRSGKSKWLEWFCRDLFKRQIGFTLIDPQGELSEALLSYFAYIRPRQPVVYFNPSRTDYIVPFNPFQEAKTHRAAKVSNYLEAILRVWNARGTDETPQLERWLRCTLHLFARGEVSLNEVYELFNWEHPDVRRYAAKVLGDDPHLSGEWSRLAAHTRVPAFEGEIGSIRNRLFRFVDFDQVRRLMSLPVKSLDFGAVFEQGAIVIANLKHTEAFSEENARLVGTLIVNELWAAARDKGRQRLPYFLLVDEVQKFLSPDIREILDRGAGKGLHLGMFHQHLTQLRSQDEWTYDSIMGNARTKLVFGGLTHPNAMIMVDAIFANQINYDETKYLIEQTKFWPVYDRDTVHTYGSASSSGSTSGSSWNTEGDFSVLSESATDFAAFQAGSADIPIYRPEPFREITSRTTYTLEEQKNRLAARLMEQYQRHYFLRRPGEKTIPVVAPFVKPFRISPQREEEYLLEKFIKPYALPVPEIDQILFKQRNALLENASQQDVHQEPDSFVSKRKRVVESRDDGG